MMLVRYLKHNGTMGEIPDWYPLMVAAKWIGCKPWELAQVNPAWEEWALIAMSAEAEAGKVEQPSA